MRVFRLKQTAPHTRKGTAIVEAALTLGLYLTILFTLFDYGYVLYLHQTLSNSAETAARYGALNPTDTNGIVNYVLYHQVTGSGTGQFGLTSSNVTVNRSGQGTSADRITITITGFKFPAIWPAATNTGKDITASLPVEAN
jgi:Flp pilus assembly protein TadG